MFGLFKKKQRPHQKEAVDRLRRAPKPTATAPAPSRRGQDDNDHFSMLLTAETMNQTTHAHSSTAHHSSSSYDSGTCGSSFDTGSASSFDSGSCGGSD